MSTNGVVDRVILAGDDSRSGRGDGFPALETGLSGPRGIWSVLTGGYLILLHDGSHLWYLDTVCIVHLLVNGADGATHGGVGDFFLRPGRVQDQ